MEEHYRRLVWAVLLVALVLVTCVGWSTLRGAPHSTVISRPDEVRAARQPMMKWSASPPGH